jgi:hypothetical protein
MKKDQKIEKFETFHRHNPKVYELFKKFAFELINAGHTRIGSQLIIERIRYETAIKTLGDDYKINNNYKPYYSRRFVRDFPEHFLKFTFRVIK